MKYTFFIFLIFLFSCGAAPHKEAVTISKDDVPLVNMGNNAGNVLCGGHIAADSDRIYYTDYDTTSRGLFSMRLDGTDLRQISHDKLEYLNVLNGWLYYRKIRTEQNRNCGGIYKMRTNATEEQRLTTDEGFYINVVNDWVYYVNWSYTTDVCKIRTDGSEQQILYAGHYELLTTDGKQLYFGSMVGGGLSQFYNGSMDGKTTAHQIIIDTVESALVNGKWIYYIDQGQEYSLCRLRRDTSDLQILFKNGDVYSKYIPYDNSIILCDGESILNFNFANKQMDTIYKGRVTDIGYAAQYLIFRTMEKDSENVEYGKTHLMQYKIKK